MFCIYIARYSILFASLLRSIIPGKLKRASSQFMSGHGLLCLSVTLADLFSIKSYSLFNCSCVRVEEQNCHPILKSAFKRFWIYSVFIVFGFSRKREYSSCRLHLFYYFYTIMMSLQATLNFHKGFTALGQGRWWRQGRHFLQSIIEGRYKEGLKITALV